MCPHACFHSFNSTHIAATDNNKLNMKQKITLRNYQNGDCEKIAELFYQTVHSVNAKDYPTEQLFAWAKDDKQLQTRRADLSKQKTLIAETGGDIAGFDSVTDDGCLDLLYVHKDFQRQGIATALCDELEKNFTIIMTYASVTAKPFFEKRGYAVTTEQEVERLGVKLKNYKMQKYFSD